MYIYRGLHSSHDNVYSAKGQGYNLHATRLGYTFACACTCMYMHLYKADGIKTASQQCEATNQVSQLKELHFV